VATKGTHKGREADEQLALLIASGLTVKAAATQAGVSLRTAHRRCGDPCFNARVEHFRSRLVADALAKLEGAMSGAADALRELIGHKDPHVRIRAAVEVLRNAVRVKEQHDLAERIRRLEELLNPQGSPTGNHQGNGTCFGRT
jgi:hypothetical protein